MNQLKHLPPHLFQHWDGVVTRIQSSRRVVVFLDFDGTLVRIAPRPDAVRLSLATRRVLERLAHQPRVVLVVISGRRRAELLRYVGIRGIRYLGLYGWERGSDAVVSHAARGDLRYVRNQFASHVASYPGLWIEDKQLSLSIHFREASPAVQRNTRHALRMLLRPFQRSLRLFENLRDAEIVPHSVLGKGIAASQFLAKRALLRAFPLYFGDDLSDESAFVAVRKGISIRVGRACPTRARYFLRGPSEVAAALSKLEAALA